jgi:hypothetical protein
MAPDSHGWPSFPEGPPPHTLVVPVRYVVLLPAAAAFDPDTIATQHRILTDAFRGTAFAFVFWELRLVRDDTLAAHCDVDTSNVFKTQILQQYATFDPSAELQVVPVFFCQLGYLGESSFPWDTTGNPHYIQIAASTLPGASPGAFFDGGKTLVHEMGHFLGLLHPFPLSPSCTDPADMVDDTPAMATEAKGCQTGRDSCPQQPGLDPIHNYMGYSADSCMTEFTPGQNIRMQQIVIRYRPSLVAQGLVAGNCSLGDCTCSALTRSCTFTPGNGSWCGCSSRGRCTADGVCDCGGGTVGDHCEWCAGWRMGPNCTQTVPSTAASVTELLVPVDSPLFASLLSLSAVEYPSLGTTMVDPEATAPKGMVWTGLSFALVGESPGSSFPHTAGSPLQLCLQLGQLWSLPALRVLHWDGRNWTLSRPVSDAAGSGVVATDPAKWRLTVAVYDVGQYAVYESGGPPARPCPLTGTIAVTLALWALLCV